MACCVEEEKKVARVRRDAASDGRSRVEKRDKR